MSDEGGPADDPGLRVLVSDRQARPLHDGEVDALVALAERTLEGEGVDRVELSMSFVDGAEMEELHVRFMGEPGATDVLSFSLGDDGDGLLGDVVICPEVAAANNPDAEAEVRLLVVHGILHLLGYDHEEGGERAAMWERQEAYSGVRAT